MEWFGEQMSWRGLVGSVDANFPPLVTQAGGLQWSQDRASERTPLTLHPLNSLETPSEGKSRPRTKCVN